MKLQMGIIGFGQMGQAISQVSAIAGHNLLIYDTNAKALEHGLEIIDKNLEKLRSLDKVHETTAMNSLLNLQIVKDLADLKDCDLVIEAVVENYQIKTELLKQLSHINQTGIIVTNTSSLSINRLAESVLNPKRFMGLHFMNPVSTIPLVEVIQSKVTSVETTNIVLQFCQSLHKTTVQAKDQPGFIVNRLLLPMINQAIHALEVELASAHDIDVAMKLGANWPIGPLALADLIGLDTCLAILENLATEGKNLTFPPSNLLKEKVSKQKLGKKTKSGFFTY